MVGVTVVASWVGGSYLDSPPPPRTGRHPTRPHYSECALCVLTQISSDWIDEQRKRESSFFHMGGGCDSSCSLGGAPVSLVLLLYSLELFFSFSSFHGIDLIIVNCRFRTCNFWYFIRTASPPSPVIPSLPSDPHNFDSPLYLDLYIVPFFERSTQLLHDLCLQILLISLLV